MRMCALLLSLAMRVHVGLIRLTVPLAVARSLSFDARIVVVAGMSLQQLAELFSNCRCNPQIALHCINPAAHTITQPPAAWCWV